MTTTIDLGSCLAAIPDCRRAEGKMYGQVGVILFSIIAMLSGARSYRQIHTLIDRRLAILNAAFPQAALRRAPAYTSVRGILQRLDPAELEQAFRRHAEGLDRSCAAAPSRFIAIDGKTLRQSFDAFAGQAERRPQRFGRRHSPPGENYRRLWAYSGDAFLPCLDRDGCCRSTRRM